MKRIIALVLGLMVVISITACSSKNEVVDDKPIETEIVETAAPVRVNIPVDELPIDGELTLQMKNGINGITNITLKSNGEFYGDYYRDAGESGEDYSNTIMKNEFWGSFEKFVKLNDYTYSLELSYWATEQDEGVEIIEEGIRYLTTTSFPGFIEETEYLLYLPEAPITDVSGEIAIVLESLDDINEDGSIGVYSLQTLAERLVFWSDESIVESLDYIEYDD